MDSSLSQSAVTPTKTRFARSITKVLQSRKTKLSEKFNNHDDKPISNNDQTHLTKFFDEEDSKLQKATMDAFIAKLFATISSVKSAYAQLQYAQSPYDAEGIQSADQIVVSELKTLSEFKQSFLKKHLNDDNTSPETTQLLAEIQEQKNLLQMYEITVKQMDNQKKLKDSEIIFLKEKLNEANNENKSIEKRLNSSGTLSSPEKLRFSSLSIQNLVFALRQTTKSIKSLVKFMISDMEASNWDLDAAASSIQPEVVFKDSNHKVFAFESFICRAFFDGFNNPSFSITDESDCKSQSRSQRFYFDKFMEMKSLKAKEYITWKPNSTFAKFCWLKYSRLVHPVMEFSLFGNLNQRNLVAAGIFPETTFFGLFADVAKRVWLLHCMALALGASVFQVKTGSRFNEVYMESVNEEGPVKTSPEVGFTVVPGFNVGKTVIQCQVYLS